MRPSKQILLLALLATTLTLGSAAQIGTLISPGPLARAHASLEGADQCVKCHEQGRRVSPARCLACHKPVAERVAARKGVHRNAANDCVACHVEHAGRDAELRPFDPKSFNHRAETGFALEGRHAIECTRCHKTRSYLTLSAQCASCHRDPHAGRLGNDCARCHPPVRPFRGAAAAFDHATTAFPLEGAHRTVLCAKCHVHGQYKGVRHGSCADCHRSPHQSRVGSDCRSCHDPASWKVADFDHAKTGTPLAGRHRAVACTRCHVRPATTVHLKLQPCAACHKDPHRGAFKQDCAACHNENGFRGAPFDHAAKTKFPLAGRHRTQTCIACHKRAGEFRGLSAQCASCHKDPHGAQLGTACAQCHDTESFRIARYTHPRFPDFFGGQHASLRCDQCHRGPVASRVYKNLSIECASCHRDVHQGQFPQCTSCHSVAAPKFGAMLFDHATTTFPLTGKHRTVECARCHESEGGVVRYRNTAKACAGCHKDPHLGQLGASCEQCHDTASFRVERYTHRKPGAFFRGKHATAQCRDCHKSQEGSFPAGRGTAVRFTGLAATCASCHADPHAGQFGKVCTSCHQIDAAWSNISRGFHKAGLFPLEGRHLVTPCGSCHLDNVIKGTPTRCYDCHWIRRQDDRYHTRLGNECEDCHRPTSWTAVTWDHAAITSFALSGIHAKLACDDCHVDAAFGAARSDCASCHRADYDRATEPQHRAAGFPLVCQLCHRPSDPSWRGARFDHSSFALAGAHTAQSCGACHGTGVYAGTPRDCVGCHRDDYDRATEPAHAQAGFGTACDTCHRFTDGQWSDGRYVHALWPLVGRHTVPRCSACHGAGVYRGRATDCLSCHRPDYERAASPNHVSARFPQTCDTCHRLADASWHEGRFAHDTFPLAGAHTTRGCDECHLNGVYAGTARTCVGCHRADYDSSADPNHAAAGFATGCEPCHRFADLTWDQGIYDHATFALAGVHLTRPCADCHRNTIYRGTARTCVGCHQRDYNEARDPNHVTASFPTTCDTCHKYTDTSWDQGVFDHTIFLLAGVHATRPCADCHINNVYRGTPRTCVGCHQDDFNRTAEPNHIAAGFSTTCDTCHKYTDASWDFGIFDHGVFPLAGLHTTRPCGECHISGVYRGTPRTCVGCHRNDYDRALDPNHVTAGFPTTCDSCHRFSDTTWDQGLFDHAIFLLAGVHATRPCADCHINGVYRGTPRTCAGCHLDDYNATRDPNHLSAGFPTSCESCHRFTDTSWDQGVFDHALFPLAGVHATRPCADCHINGVYRGTPRTCAGCHLDDYNATRDPNHLSAGFPTSCESCHRFTDTSWNQGVFNHLFPIRSGAHVGRACTDCHTTPNNYQLFSCTTNCHSRAETDPDHDEVSGYRYDSLACYACHPQGRS